MNGKNSGIGEHSAGQDADGAEFGEGNAISVTSTLCAGPLIGRTGKTKARTAPDQSYPQHIPAQEYATQATGE